VRSTQFDDHVPFEDEEQHPRRRHPEGFCETLKRPGYGQKPQVRLNGRVFEWVSDPISAGENPVLVDARERESRSLHACPYSADGYASGKKKIAPHKQDNKA